MKSILLVGIGGFAGSILRYAVSMIMVPLVSGTGFPWATLTVNVVGSLVIGLLLSLGVNGIYYYLCVVGFCGGFTTFSTFSNELVQMIRTGHNTMGAVYMVTSLLFSVLAVWLGIVCGAKLNVLIK